jgi:benzylsuccinate CoA-transferase BbsE subunit
MKHTGSRPYSGVRIIDLSGDLGAYSARLFADLGAEVIHVAPPGQVDGREPWSASHAFLNANKKSVVLDTSVPGGRQVLLDLASTAQVVLLAGDEAGRALLPEVVALPGGRVVSVFSYFGLSGPYSSFVGCDLVAQALGGITWLSGEPGQPPLRITGDQSLFVTSLYGAVATAMAFWDVEMTQASHVLDISAQECIAHSLQNTLQVYDLEGRVFSRGGTGTRDATENPFACRDGYVFLAAPLAVPASWNGVLQWMKEEGYPGGERLREADWQDRAARATEPMKHEFKAIFEGFIGGKTKTELAAEALKRKIVMAPVSTVSELPGDPQLVYRNYFHRVHDRTLDRELLFPGAPYRLSEPVWSIGRGAPRPGEDTQAVLRDLPVPAANPEREGRQPCIHSS